MYRHVTSHCGELPLSTALAQLVPVLAGLAGRENKAAAPLLDLPATRDDLAEIRALALSMQKRFQRIVVVGIGGSGLSGRTLVQLAKPGVDLQFLENIDPDTMQALLDATDWNHTGCITISKSGNTVEVLSQFYVLWERAQKALGAKAKEHFTVITENRASPLKRAAEKHKLATLNHPNDIGGRFSILSNVGLLPAAIAGLDIAALREGARQVVAELDAALSPKECAPALGAALQYAHMKEGRNLSVMLPYCERLSVFSAWYRQIWAESLGKEGRGSTPIRAVGATDQHSQLQLYLDGPKDKLFHMILLNRAGSGVAIPVPDEPELAYLKGKTIGDVMAAEQKATLESLVKNGCPVRVFELEKLDETSLGALLMHFMLETIFMAALLGVNPFDQPAVEEGKAFARDYLRTGNL